MRKFKKNFAVGSILIALVCVAQISHAASLAGLNYVIRNSQGTLIYRMSVRLDAAFEALLESNAPVEQSCIGGSSGGGEGNNPPTPCQNAHVYSEIFTCFDASKICEAEFDVTADEIADARHGKITHVFNAKESGELASFLTVASFHTSDGTTLSCAVDQSGFRSTCSLSFDNNISYLGPNIGTTFQDSRFLLYFNDSDGRNLFNALNIPAIDPSGELSGVLDKSFNFSTGPGTGVDCRQYPRQDNATSCFLSIDSDVASFALPLNHTVLLSSADSLIVSRALPHGYKNAADSSFGGVEISCINQSSCSVRFY